ncbi:MAG: DUF1801 domain-containing protein [Aeromicrobium sp.]|uniref:DUF1801 domain-containing protein n=1 Tax=Aeromicrobium sp. TaxID=1871063 RepID=UPI0039E51C47
MASEAKTRPTDVPVEEFLTGKPARQAAESETLTDLMRRLTGHEPVMWGPSIVGFDSYHYVYDSGREGDAPALGFSPRSGTFAIYLDDCANHVEALARLGPHRASKACLYVKKLSDVDLDVLEEILRASLAATKAAYG